MSRSNAVWGGGITRVDMLCMTHAKRSYSNKRLANSFEKFLMDFKALSSETHVKRGERLTLVEALRNIFDSKSVDGKCFFHVLIDAIMTKPQVLHVKFNLF